MSNVYTTILEVEDVRIVFLKLRGQYVGLDVCKSTFSPTRDDKMLKTLIVKYMRSVGFQTKKDYLEALPGYTGDEHLGILPALVYNYIEKVEAIYDNDVTKHVCDFEFEYVVGEDDTYKTLMDYFNTYIVNPKNKTEYPLLTIVPTLEEIRQVFYNEPDEKLWFCKEVLVEGE